MNPGVVRRGRRAPTERARLRVGIDPGASGAIAIVREDMSLVAYLLMPTIKTGKNTRVNGAACAAFLQKYCEGADVMVYLELVGSMPKQGVASTFSFGHSAGLIEGIVQGAGLPYSLIRPAVWKKRAGLVGQDKDAARSRCVQLYPHLRVLDLKGKGQALSDALLIARYGIEDDV